MGQSLKAELIYSSGPCILQLKFVSLGLVHFPGLGKDREALLGKFFLPLPPFLFISYVFLSSLFHFTQHPPFLYNFFNPFIAIYSVYIKQTYSV